jgi:hypothetical protein
MKYFKQESRFSGPDSRPGTLPTAAQYKVDKLTTTTNVRFATCYGSVLAKHTINMTTKRTVKVQLHSIIGEDVLLHDYTSPSVIRTICWEGWSGYRGIRTTERKTRGRGNMQKNYHSTLNHNFLKQKYSA